MEGTLGIFVGSPSHGCASTANPLSLYASLAIKPCVLCFEAFQRCGLGGQTAPPGRAYGLGFMAQMSNIVVLWYTTADLVRPPRQAHS
jgi:hypothetical protein